MLLFCVFGGWLHRPVRLLAMKSKGNKDKKGFNSWLNRTSLGGTKNSFIQEKLGLRIK